jgi:uncharacterized sulfatase
MKESKRSNILLITSDQQHWFTIGIQNKEIKTPNLDRLAKRGTLFTRAYTVNPTCTPTRASIITGKYPSHHGAWTLGTKLPESEHTVGDDFINAGYRTALIGKAHFQPLKSTDKYPSLESNPLQQDLDFWRKFNDRFYGFEDIELARNHADEFLVGQHYAIWMEEKGFDWKKCFSKPVGTAEPQRHTWNIPEEYHYDTWIAERTNAKLEEYHRNGENFFLWASFLDPHPPYLVPEPWDKMYDPEKLTIPSITTGEHDKNPEHHQMTQTENPDFSSWHEKDGEFYMHGLHSHLHNREDLKKDIAVYYGMISLMDKYIGKILDKLDELGMSEDTLIVFTTDHGHFFGHHGLIAKGPFHYEDMVKLPFIVSMPGRVPVGRVSDSMQSIADLAPTFLSVAGLDIPRDMTGVDQKDVWFGNRDSVRDHVVVEHHHQPTTIHLKTYIDERYKITVYYNREYGEIFDLQNDPEEINNLWNNSSFKELKLELLQKLIHAEMEKEPMWMPRVWGA